MSLPKFWAVLSSQSAFSWRNSVQKILFKWLSKRLVRHIILCQKWFKLRNDDIEDSEVKNRLEKKDFADGRVKDVKSLGSFSPSRQFCVVPNNVRKTWLPRQFQNGGLRSRSCKTNSSRLDPGHLRDWNLGELKSWMSTCFGGSQKIKLSGVSSSKFTCVKGGKKQIIFIVDLCH